MTFRFSLLLLVALSLQMGCQTVAVKTTEKAPDVHEDASPPPEQKSPRVNRTALIATLLEQAKYAAQVNQLTRPAHDNAYDRYSAVLMMDPQNAEAQNGLMNIALSFADQFRENLARGRLSPAKLRLTQLRSYFPDSPLIQPLQEALNEAQVAVNERREKEEDAKEGEQLIELDAAGVAGQSEVVVAQLQEIAQQVRSSDSSVMIFARSDSEGRWIYKVMKESAEGYRIRGDIRRSHRVALKLMAPL